jgi:hypothetical protein
MGSRRKKQQRCSVQRPRWLTSTFFRFYLFYFLSLQMPSSCHAAFLSEAVPAGEILLGPDVYALNYQGNTAFFKYYHPKDPTQVRILH